MVSCHTRRVLYARPCQPMIDCPWRERQVTHPVSGTRRFSGRNHRGRAPHLVRASRRLATPVWRRGSSFHGGGHSASSTSGPYVNPRQHEILAETPRALRIIFAALAERNRPPPAPRRTHRGCRRTPGCRRRGIRPRRSRPSWPPCAATVTLSAGHPASEGSGDGPQHVVGTEHQLVGRSSGAARAISR